MTKSLMETAAAQARPPRPSPAWLMDAGIIAVAMLTMAIMLAATPMFGSVSLLLPILAALALLGAAGAARLLVGSKRAIAIFLFLVTVALDLNFRSRVAGETGLDWQNGMKLGAWMLMLALTVRHISSWRTVAADPAVALLTAFCIFCLMSAAWSPVGSYTFACAVGGLAWAGFAFVCATRLTDAEVLRPLVFALALECAVGLIVGTLMPDLGWLQDYDSDGVRLAGLSGHPNLLGQHAALLVLVALSAYEGKAIRKVHWIAIEILALTALLLTGSRTAILAMLAALLVVHLRTHGRTARVVMPALLISAALFLFVKSLGMMPDFESVFAFLSRSGNASEIMTATNRSDLWVIAWHHFLERPLLGWGFNGTEQLMIDSVDSNFPGNAVNAHNIVFQGLMSVGLLGSIAVFGYLLILFSRMFTQPDRLRDRIVIFCLALGVGEAELLSIPLIMSFLTFWCVFRDGRRRAQLVQQPVRDVDAPPASHAAQGA